MALGPIVKGATRPIWTGTLLKTDGSTLDITGASFTGVLFDEESTQSVTLTPGNFAISSAAGGVFTYTPVAGDVATVGDYTFEVSVSLGGGTYKGQMPLTIVESKT
jgi:hypothetical protein